MNLNQVQYKVNKKNLKQALFLKQRVRIANRQNKLINRKMSYFKMITRIFWYSTLTALWEELLIYGTRPKITRIPLELSIPRLHQKMVNFR